jgi:hypothetical protein
VPIVKLTPITSHGRDLLDLLESKTGVPPFIESSGAKAYRMAGSANLDRFESVLYRIERDWPTHLSLKLLSE